MELSSTMPRLSYISVPTGTPLRLSLHSYATGSFTLDIEKVQGDTTLASTTFSAIPSSTSTIATINIPQDGNIANASPLIVDENGDGKADITLAPKLGGIVTPDFTPPQTTASTTGTLGTNGWYTSNTVVKFSATDTGSGVKDTRYSTTSGALWNTYSTTTPLTISNEGSTTILYYSTDNAGNREATSSLRVKIDKITPNASISIDSATKDLKVEGTDNISSTTVSKNTANNAYTITDAAGHTTKLFFQKTFTGKLLTYAKLTGVQYDNVPTVTLPSPSFLYLWQSATPQTLVSQTIAVDGTYGIEALYDVKKNKTTVLLKKKGSVIQTQTFTGLRIVKLTVNKGVVGYEI